MDNAFNSAMKVYNNIVGEINSGAIPLHRGNVCETCLDTGFMYVTERDRWGREYPGVIKSYDCCRYWQIRAEKTVERKKIDKTR